MTLLCVDCKERPRVTVQFCARCYKRSWSVGRNRKDADRKWAAQHIGERRDRAARRRRAAPKWADLKAIQSFYSACPPGFHVDHVIPLMAKTVSGLHVLENLQYLPAIENLRKGNRVCIS